MQAPNTQAYNFLFLFFCYQGCLNEFIFGMLNVKIASFLPKIDAQFASVWGICGIATLYAHSSGFIPRKLLKSVSL